MNLSTYEFTRPTKNQRLKVTVVETLETELGYFVWPSAKATAQFVCNNENLFNGKSILEVRLVGFIFLNTFSYLNCSWELELDWLVLYVQKLVHVVFFLLIVLIK